MYGSIDNGVDYTSNRGGKASYQALSSVKWGSRVGFTGREDLDGGMAAIFTLENGFDGFSGALGQGGLMFGRQAFVGLSSRYGTFTAGRQYDSVANYLGALATSDQWAGYPGAHPGDYDNVNDAFRENNAFKYASPNLNGFTFNGLIAPGGVAGSTTKNRIFSTGGGYTAGGFTLNAAYLNVKNPATAAYGGTVTPVTGTTYLNPVTSPVYRGYASARTYSVFGTATKYTFKGTTLGAMYTYTSFADIVTTSSTPNAGSVKFHNLEVSVMQYITPSLMVDASYDFTKAERAHYHQVNAMLDYFLSKRTDAYLLAVAQDASGIDSTGTTAVASINGLTASRSSHQLFLRAGINHKF
ncbi:porin [Paraburkholderia caffeinilytica]|uniref:Porin n=1 Tax=Paraburkholderia caffeinilytica TaxID=1761016 RepID=A0ABQ1NAP7_9BURK|nr:porin [Paraburkholderia caffeinilytica]